jgi:hypothetical protein
MAPPKTKRVRRVLLAATVGLATLTLEGCLFTSGNLVAPPPVDSGPDTGTDAGVDAGASGNTDAGEPDAP